MANKEKFSPPAVGGSSLLVIFAVLCLTIFALLGLATVQANARLSDASAKAVEDYYAADCRAGEILARLRNGDGAPSDVEVRATLDDAPDGQAVFAYTVPISDTQELRVEVALAGSDYRVLRWQAVPVGEWNPDDTLPIWDGQLGDGLPQF